MRHITIIQVRKPVHPNLNDELQWLGESLGLFHLRDKDKSCYRVFLTLMKAAKAGIPLSSDEIALQTGLSRGTVVHHINKLIESGLVIPTRKRYMMRHHQLKMVIEELKRDMERAFAQMEQAAKELDHVLGLE